MRKMNHSMKKGHEAFSKSIAPGQPVQSVQAVFGRNILPEVSFLHIKGPRYLIIHLVFKTESKLSRTIP